jgi:hypothetical protein
MQAPNSGVLLGHDPTGVKILRDFSDLCEIESDEKLFVKHRSLSA